MNYFIYLSFCFCLPIIIRFRYVEQYVHLFYTNTELKFGWDFFSDKAFVLISHIEDIYINKETKKQRNKETTTTITVDNNNKTVWELLLEHDFVISLDHSLVSDLHNTEQELKLRSPIFQEEFSAIGCSFSEYFQKSHIPMKTSTKFQNFDIFCIIDSLFPVNIFVMKCANERLQHWQTC